MPSYVEFRAHFEPKFGKAQTENLRKKWQEVQLPKNFGKTTLQHFDEFRVNFKLALADVLDATPEEARRVLIDKLNPFMKKWVVEAEAKKMKTKCVVEITMRNGLSADTVSKSIQQWIGISPLKVESRGGGVYWLLFGDERLADKLLALHGRETGSGVKLQVHVVEQHLSVDDLFYEVASKMELQEKTADYQRRANCQNSFSVRETNAQKKSDFKQSRSNERGNASGGGWKPPG